MHKTGLLFFATGAWMMACVGDSNMTTDSGTPDSTSDVAMQPEGGNDAASDVGMDGDGSDGARPVPPATGTFEWELVGPGTIQTGAAYDPSGNLFFAFSFYAPTTMFNGMTYTSAGTYDTILAKVDPTGKVLWARQYGGSGDDQITGVVTDSAGDVYVGFVTNSPSFSFGNGVTYTRQGTNYDGLVVKLKGSNGDGIWVGDYAKTTENYLYCDLAYGGGRLGITCLADQGLALTKVSDMSALTVSCLECGGTSPQDNNIYAATLDPSTGRAYWGTVVAASMQTNAVALGVDSTGALAFTVSSFGPLIHDPTNSINFTYKGLGGNSVIVIKLAPASGAGVWIKEFVDPTSNNNNQADPGGIAFDSANNVVIGGKVLGTVPFDTINLMAGSYPNYDAFVAKLKAGFGDVIWARTFGGSKEDDIASVAVDPWDEVLVTGQYQSTDAKLDGFSFPAVPSGQEGVYIGKLDANAMGLWATGIVSATTIITPRNPPGVVVDWSSGSVANIGFFQGTVDLGDGNPVSSPSGVEDNFVVARKP